MKTFKALYIDNGVIKAGEFPEPVIVCNQITECESPQRQSCRCVNYHKALASAKANALLIGNPELLEGVLPERMKEAKGRVVPLCPGWDYRVEERKIGGRSVKDKNGIAYDYETYTEKVAKLYRTEEQTKIEELRKKLHDFLATQTKEQLEKWLEMDRERMKQPEPEESQEDLWWSVLELMENEDPKPRPMIPQLMKHFTITRRK